MTLPVKTSCGHSFCRQCISGVVCQQKATCPLCNASLKRRSITEDEHTEMCIVRFEHLISAIQKDTGIDILSVSKQPQHTKESCTSESEENEENLKKPLNITHRDKNTPLSDRKTINSEAKRNEKQSALPFARQPLETPKKRESSVKSVERRTANEDEFPLASTSFANGNNNFACNSEDEINLKESDLTNASREFRKAGRRSNGRNSKRENRTQRRSAGKGDESLKFKTVHARVHAIDANESKTKNVSAPSQKALDMSESSDHTSPNSAISSAKDNWSRVVKFGREMRTRKKKLKSLDVSIKNKNTSKSSDRSEEESFRSNVQQRRSLDKDYRTNDAERNSTATEEVEDKSDNSSFQENVPAQFITLKEGEKVHIGHLNSAQMSEIIGTLQNRTPEKNVLSLNRRSSSRNSDRIDRTPIRNQNDFTPLSQREPVNSDACNSQRIGSNRKLSLNRTSESDSKSGSHSPICKERLLKVKRNFCDESSQQNRLRPILPSFEERIEKCKREDQNNDKTGVDKSSSKENRKPFVVFQKLGKIREKTRRKAATFLYLGPTRRRWKAKSTKLDNCTFFFNCKSRTPASNVQNELREFKEEALSMEVDRSPQMQHSPKETPLSSKDLNRNQEKEKLINDEEEELTHKSCSIDATQPLQTLYVSLSNPEESNSQKTRLKTFGNVEDGCGRRKPTILDVKILSPEKDSQLKFFGVSSPVDRALRNSRIAPQDTEKNSERTPEIKGASTPITSEKEDARLSCPSNESRKKRKRSSSSEEERCQKSKKTLRNDEQSRGNDSPVTTAIGANTLPEKGSGTPEKGKQENSSEALHRTPESSFSDTCEKSIARASPNDIYSAATLLLKWESQDEPKARVLPSVEKEYRPIVTYNTDSSSIDGAVLNKKQKSFSREVERSAGCNDGNSDYSVGSKRAKNVHKAGRVEEIEKANGTAGPKRKLGFLDDSDDDEVDVKAIVSSWCTDLPTSQPSKRGKSDSGFINAKTATASATRSPDVVINPGNTLLTESTALKETSSLDADFFESGSTFFQSNNLARTVISAEEDRSDRVQKLQRTTSHLIDTRDQPTLPKDSSPRRTTSRSMEMRDTFDEILANVESFPQSTELIPPTEEETRRGTSIARGTPSDENHPPESGLNCEPSLPKTDNVFADSRREFCREEARAASAASNNENNEVKGSEDADEKTLTPEAFTAVVADKTIKPGAVSREYEDLRANSNSPVLAEVGESYPMKEISLNDESTAFAAKDTEHDSLMAVTQQQLWMKQFEEDLFGKGSAGTSGNSWENAKGSLCKVAEHSVAAVAEDDVVESTQRAKVKRNGQNGPIDSPDARKFPRSSPDSPIPRTTETSTTSERSSDKTPWIARPVLPRHHSTPKLPKAPPEISAVKTSGKQQQRQLCFVCSALSRREIERVRELASLVGARYTNQFDEKVTHVIVKANERTRGAEKTLKYLQGVAYRKWIVAYKWVLDSLHCQKLLDEESYEAVDSETLEPGPRNSRLRTADLFKGFAILCIGPFNDVSEKQYQDLLLATGAAVVETTDALAAEKKKLKAIVIEDEAHSGETILKWHRTTGAAPIIRDWIVECISQYRLIPLCSYLLELEPRDLLALGYPENLIEDDESVSDAST